MQAERTYGLTSTFAPFVAMAQSGITMGGRKSADAAVTEWRFGRGGAVERVTKLYRVLRDVAAESPAAFAMLHAYHGDGDGAWRKLIVTRADLPAGSWEKLSRGLGDQGRRAYGARVGVCLCTAALADAHGGKVAITGGKVLRRPPTLAGTLLALVESKGTSDGVTLASVKREAEVALLAAWATYATHAGVDLVADRDMTAHRRAKVTRWRQRTTGRGLGLSAEEVAWL